MPEEREKRPRGRPRSAETAFSKWIDASPRSTRKLMAEELGVTVLYVNDLCSGRRTPSLALKKSIARLTRGGFKEDMWEDTPPKKESPEITSQESEDAADTPS